MMSHTIRLRGPWKCQPLARAAAAADGSSSVSTADLPPASTLAIPGDWSPLLGPQFAGLVRFSRRFNAPTGLTSASRVWLIVEAVGGQAAVFLNEKPLGSIVGDNPAALPASSLPEPAQSILQGPAQPCPARFELPPLRDSRNEIAIDLFSLGLGRLGLVRLEIED